MTLDAESTFKWKSHPALDALAHPGGGIKGGGNPPGGPATTDADIKKATSRPSPTCARASRVLGNHAERPSPYPHLASSLDRKARPGGEAGPVRPANGKADLNKQHDEQYPMITCTSGRSGVADR